MIITKIIDIFLFILLLYSSIIYVNTKISNTNYLPFEFNYKYYYHISLKKSKNYCLKSHFAKKFIKKL